MLFVLLAAALAVAALAFVLRPLWSQRPWLGASLIVALALTTGLFYALVGTPAAFDVARSRPPATLAEAIVQLEAELERDPNQIEGWRLLGRSYAAENRRPEARDAFARALALASDDPDVLVEAAEARALASDGNRFDPQAVALLRDALAKQPMHQRGRWFLGIAQRQAGDHAAAAQTWEPLLAVVSADTARSLRPQIDAAREEAGLSPLPVAANEAGAASTTAASAADGGDPTARADDEKPIANALRVRVTLDPDFAARVRLRGDASVFVIARVPGGPPMPVAVEKHPVSSLPLEITLDDADGPMPTQKLSTLKEVELIARLSSSGNAMRQDGDIESPSVRVTLPAKQAVQLQIETGSR